MVKILNKHVEFEAYMKYIMIIPPYEAMKEIVDKTNPKKSLLDPYMEIIVN